MNSSNLHVAHLIKLRAELVKERRASVIDGRSENLSALVVSIDAIDRSIADEKKLAELLD